MSTIRTIRAAPKRNWARRRFPFAGDLFFFSFLKYIFFFFFACFSVEKSAKKRKKKRKKTPICQTIFGILCAITKVWIIDIKLHFIDELGFGSHKYATAHEICDSPELCTSFRGFLSFSIPWEYLMKALKKYPIYRNFACAIGHRRLFFADDRGVKKTRKKNSSQFYIF